METKAQFILSKSKVIEKYKEIKSISDEISYSFKTNREVGSILKDNTECFFSVHSPKAVEMLKVSQRVWYFAHGWDKDEIKDILNKGVKGFVVDNSNDLNLLLELLKKEEQKASVFLRMRLKEKTVHTGKHFVFGFYSSQINELIPTLRQNKNIENIGIHFHRKTQNISEWDFKYELENVIEKDILKSLDYVNIGGGVPVRYKNFSADVIEGIFNKIVELKKWLNENNVKMIIEPGRFIAAPSVKLKTQIMNIIDDTIILGCSVYNGAMDTFVTNIRLEVENELSKEQGAAYTLKGKTPDSIDIFRYRVYLKKPQIKDEIVFLNAGAYTYSTDFCLLEPLPTLVVD
ncbi:MAG: decarboxylase [Candidatus Nanoarchaeia archaeon]